MIIKMLKRSWSSGESRLLALAVVLAVTVLTAISVFSARLENTLMVQSNAMIGADYLLESPQPLEPDWLNAAPARSLKQTQTVLFASMAYVGDALQLVSVKAVAEGYPLRGHFETSAEAFATDATQIDTRTDIPAPGQVWVDGRVLAALKLNVGDSLGIGEREFTVARVLVREPDATSLFSVMGGPRVLMNAGDVASTQVVQPGSRVTYQYLFASEDGAALARHRLWVDENKSEHLRVRDLESAENRVTRTLSTARQFLVITAVMAVLLAGVAIAIAARRYSEQQVPSVALLKSLGVSIARIRYLYVGLLLVLGMLASAIGVVLGQGLQALVAWGVRSQFETQLAAAGALPYGLSLVAGIGCLLVFALPALWYLPKVPPLRILRSDMALTQTRPLSQLLIILAALVVLIAVFSRDWILALAMTASLLLVVALGIALSLGGLLIVRRFALGRGGVWRIAFANVHRRRLQSAVMVLVFGIALMLLASLTLLRSSLISEWEMQIPADAPNHFLVNIPAAQNQSLADLLTAEGVAAGPLYPMVRGRLVAINQVAPSEAQKQAANSLRRELNITWSDSLAADNKIVAGAWWDAPTLVRKTDFTGVSIEQEDAARIGLKLGDVLTFSLGGLTLNAEVLSIRSLDWQSMRPNFFYILEPGTQIGLSPTYITSFYLPPARKALLNKLLVAHPSVMVVELDRVMTQIRTIITQVSNAVLLVVFLTLLGGALVLYAAVISSIDSRRQEVGLLRAMGASRGVMTQSLALEFAILGGLAGFLAALGAQSLALSIQFFVLEMPLQLNLWVWVLMPAGGAMLIAALGYYACRSLVQTPPAAVLREAA